jgi:demethylmenaquinone methyltransferase/2-methoxy-6-polyprenyl-1,4-benzoquinol methylase
MCLGIGLKMSELGITVQPERVRRMFGSIAPRYDLANHVLSLGIDFYWRKRAAAIVANWQPNKIVDLATGTGDLALALQKKIPKAEIVGVDFLREMVDLAKRKGVGQTVVADVMKLPFGDGSFDCATIAFGLRNMEDCAGALREMSRVLGVNGHVLILEFSLPTMSILRAIYRFYLHHCLPLLGSLLTKKKGAYEYLAVSIEQFPSGHRMAEFIAKNGFMQVRFKTLTGGIVTIYTATAMRNL